MPKRYVYLCACDGEYLYDEPKPTYPIPCFYCAEGLVSPKRRGPTKTDALMDGVAHGWGPDEYWEELF